MAEVVESIRREVSDTGLVVVTWDILGQLDVVRTWAPDVEDWFQELGLPRASAEL
jgi:hypothetical protein